MVNEEYVMAHGFMSGPYVRREGAIAVRILT